MKLLFREIGIYYIVLTCLVGCSFQFDENEDNLFLYKDVGFSEAKVDLNLVSCIKASTFCVSNKTQFEEALSSQAEQIVFRDGIYDLGVVNISYKIKLVSENLWGAVLTGSTYIYIQSDDVEIDSLYFENGASPSGGKYSVERFGSVTVEGSNILLKNNIFDGIGKNSTVADKTGIAIQINKASDIVIDNNMFRNSRSIAIKTDDYSKRVIVSNNDFLDSSNFGGAGEVFHIGNGQSESQGESGVNDDTSSIFKNNFIRNWNLEKELISIKSNDNEVSGNLMVNNGNSAIVVRMGNRNRIINNRMIGNVDFPVRISGEHNHIIGNVFCGKGAMVAFHQERGFTEIIPDLFNSYWAANDNLIVSNTFLGYSTAYEINQGYAAPGSDYFINSPKNNVFLGNYIYSSKLVLTSFTNSVVEFEQNAVNQRDKQCILQD